MTVVTARITVDSSHRISGQAPSELAPGEHEAIITVPAPHRTRRSVRDMLTDDRPWDQALSLRREDMYGDDER